LTEVIVPFRVNGRQYLAVKAWWLFEPQKGRMPYAGGMSHRRHRLAGAMRALTEANEKPMDDAPVRPRRPKLDPDELLTGLNGPQRAAVTHAGSPLLIVAGAGSGKTRVLTHRIAYLLAARDVHPGQIIAITFTNKAAGEMKERVASLVGGRARLMWVSTFHSACVRILRAEHDHAGLKSTFSIYDADDSRRLMQMVARELDLDPKRFPARGLAAQVSNLKNELVDPEAFAARAAGPLERALAEAYTLYQGGSKRRTRSTSTT
jgi:DNA helicase-2/ATP-dependent DNA helicase PcrA